MAQTVTAGSTGDLMRVELGIGCDGGALIIEIVNLASGRAPPPGTVVRSRTTIDAATIPNPPATADVRSRPLAVDLRWRRFAIVLRNETGSCTALKGPTALDGSSYPGGKASSAAMRAPIAWLQFLDFGETGDLGFKTIVNVPAARRPAS